MTYDDEQGRTNKNGTAQSGTCVHQSIIDVPKLLYMKAVFTVKNFTQSAHSPLVLQSQSGLWKCGCNPKWNLLESSHRLLHLSRRKKKIRQSTINERRLGKHGGPEPSH